MSQKKYAVFPGEVVSKIDEGLHFIGFGKLCRLYGVPVGECVDMSRPESWQGRDVSKLEPLRVSPSGNYSRCVPLWRSAVSGLWYRKTGAAGSINATMCQQCKAMLERNEDETGLQWIHRVAEWWEAHHAAPPQVDTRRTK